MPGKKVIRREPRPSARPHEELRPGIVHRNLEPVPRAQPGQETVAGAWCVDEGVKIRGDGRPIMRVKCILLLHAPFLCCVPVFVLAVIPQGLPPAGRAPHHRTRLRFTYQSGSVPGKSSNTTHALAPSLSRRPAGSLRYRPSRVSHCHSPNAATTHCILGHQYSRGAPSYRS